MSGEVVGFELQTPLNEKTIRKHIRHALALGFPDALGEPEVLTIIAGGPSAWEAPQDGPTLVLNGALRVCKSPTYYAACDPQALVADFLTQAPKDTLYYMASKCHPDVFKALKGRDVRLWHVGDYVQGGIPTAPSITLVALNLFARMGWRKFNIYGWDCCYKNGKHHASDQPHNGDDRWVEVGDKKFHTTTTWANEAQDALYVIPFLEFLGVEINIFGGSMIQAIREYQAKAA